MGKSRNEWELREEEQQVFSKGKHPLFKEKRALLFRRGKFFASYAIETTFKAVVRRLRSTTHISFVAFDSSGNQV